MIKLYKKINISEFSNKLNYFEIYKFQNILIVNIYTFAELFNYNINYLIRYYKIQIICETLNIKYVKYTNICEVFQRGRKDYLKKIYRKIENELNIRSIISSCKEVNICENIINYLDDKYIRYKRNYKCGPYRIDMYLPDENIAIEINENNHQDRDQEYENSRFNFIQKQLFCQYHIINPDEPNFTIYSMFKKLNNILLQ